MGYSTVAVNATLMAIEKNVHPLDAWQLCAKAEYPNSEPSQSKGCPKSTFLGLCEAGKVLGIPANKYTSSKDNKRYALRALEFLASSKMKKWGTSELWNEVLKFETDKNKRHNSQMDVVISLWHAGLLKMDE